MWRIRPTHSENLSVCGQRVRSMCGRTAISISVCILCAIPAHVFRNKKIFLWVSLLATITVWIHSARNVSKTLSEANGLITIDSYETKSISSTHYRVPFTNVRLEYTPGTTHSHTTDNYKSMEEYLKRTQQSLLKDNKKIWPFVLRHAPRRNGPARFIEREEVHVHLQGKKPPVHNITRCWKRTLGIRPSDMPSVLYKINVSKEMERAVNGSPESPLPNYRSHCWVSRQTAYPPIRMYTHNPYFTGLCKNGGKGQDHCGPDFLYTAERITEELKLASCNTSDGNINVSAGFNKMRCLPYVYLIGVTKAGTTDLYSRLLLHPDIIGASMKEPMWFDRFRVGVTSMKFKASLTDYLDLFDRAAHDISLSTDHRDYRSKITADGTPCYFWDYDGWQTIPGNIGLKEPRYTLPQSVRAVNPSAKILLILRQPTDRLYSHFAMKFSQISHAEVGVLAGHIRRQPAYPQQFHRVVEKALFTFRRCLLSNTARGCAYDRQVFNEQRDNIYLRASLYSIFLCDWLKVFPKDQILVIRGEDYYHDLKNSLRRIFSFLGLDDLDESEWAEIIHNQVRNSRQYEPMLNTTRILLDQFFEPFNKDLAEMLNDDSFLWN